MVQAAGQVEVEVDQTALLYWISIFQSKYWLDEMYLSNVLAGAAVDVTTGAALAQEAVEQVAQRQQTTVSVSTADDGLVALTDAHVTTLLLGFLAAIVSGHSNGSQSQSRDSENVLHCEGEMELRVLYMNSQRIAFKTLEGVLYWLSG